MDLHTSSSIRQIEAINKFACKVCLKRWNMNYDKKRTSLPCQLIVYTQILQCAKIIKKIFLILLYKVYMRKIKLTYSYSYSFLYYIRLFAHSIHNYMQSSFVPSVIISWKYLSPVKTLSSIIVYHLLNMHCYVIFSMLKAHVLLLA